METTDVNELEAYRDYPLELSQERGALLHDKMVFEGKPIRPISAGSMALLERTKNGIIFGDATSILFDSAAFVLLHTDDERTFAPCVRAIFDGKWPQMVIDWLDRTKDAQTKLTDFVPQIVQLRKDYAAALTRQVEGAASGNVGGHTG